MRYNLCLVYITELTPDVELPGFFSGYLKRAWQWQLNIEVGHKFSDRVPSSRQVIENDTHEV